MNRTPNIASIFFWILTYGLLFYELFFEKMSLRFFIAVFMFDFLLIGVFLFFRKIGEGIFSLAMSQRPRKWNEELKNIFMMFLLFFSFLIFNYFFFVLINSLDTKDYLFNFIGIYWYLILILILKNIFMFFKWEDLISLFVFSAIKLFLIISSTIFIVLIVFVYSSTEDISSLLLTTKFLMTAAFILINGLVDFLVIFLKKLNFIHNKV